MSELPDLRRQLADLQAACEQARGREAAMRAVVAGLRGKINAPLSVLIPLVDLMLQEADERALPLTAREDLVVLQRHLERLRCAAGVLEPEAEHDRHGRCDLNAVLQDTLARTANRFERSGVRVHAAFDEGLPPIPGNPVALGQAFKTLLDNALDTVEAGGVVWVETSTHRPAGVRVVIRDDGDGVPDQARAIFGESFAALEQDGAELGLSITRAIVEGHGGTIELRSATGAGTTWIVLLPGRNGYRADP